MNKLIVAFALCVSVLVFAIEATARPGPGGGPDRGDMVGRMSQHLDLSADQQEQITTIVNAAQLDDAVDQEHLRQIEKELRGLAENFDAGSAQALADESNEIHVDGLLAERAMLPLQRMLNFAKESVTPSACGIAPPLSPVPAPRATTGTPMAWQDFKMPCTWS